MRIYDLTSSSHASRAVPSPEPLPRPPCGRISERPHCLAIFYAQIKPLSRGDGRSSVAAAAYRAGERLEDARTGLVHDYTRRSGVSMAEVLTPEGSVDRSALWNAAEAVEKRKDSRTAREWVLALPSELDAPAREELARSFAAELVRRYGVAVDMAIHEPGKEGDERNHHAHLLATTRRVERDGSGSPVMGEKTPLELSDTKRRAMGLGPAAAEVTELRQVWEGLANAALERAGRSERIDSRSLEAQGVDREPTRHLGPAATAMERRQGSRLGDENREVQRRNAERERLAAEIIDLQAERERRAQEERARVAREAEAKRKAAEDQARQAENARRAKQQAERVEAMTAQELAREIARLRPESPEKLALQSPETAQAQERVRLLAEERQAVEARRQQAEAGISAYRKRYRLRASLHDMGLMKSRDLTKHAQTIAGARREEARLDPLASTALSEFAMLKDQASARIAKEQEPLLKLVAGMEELQAYRAREEARAAAREAQAHKEAEERLAAERAAQAAKEAQAAAREAQARKEAEERRAVERAAQAAKEREEARKRAEQEAPRPKTSPKEPPAPDREEAQRAEQERQENAERVRQWNEKRARDRARGWDRDR